MAAGERYKGHDELLDVLRRLAPAHPALRLVVAGGGDDQPRLESEATRLGVANRVQFTGFVDGATLSELYRRCAALVMPSSAEGFGLVYLEAMRAGKPCVALAGSAAAEIVADGVTGLLIATGAEPLATAIAALMADPARREAMGRAGRERFLQHFRAESFATRLHPRLDALLLGRGTQNVAAPAADSPTPHAASVR
jgi:phosphatidyl-myo-inositol dimannoside synthase